MAASELTFQDIQSAADRRDPSLLQMITSFLEQYDPDIPDDAPDGTMSFYSLKYELLNSWQLRRLEPGEARFEYRQSIWETYNKQEFDAAPRLQLDGLLQSLFEEGGEWARQLLLQLIATAPLKWGPWRAIKQLFKRAEENDDYEIVGAVAVRCDVELSAGPSYSNDVTAGTLAYLRRRGWRYLRQLGQALPELYPSAAVHFLRWYPQQDGWNADDIWRKMWISNHIFFHEHRSKHGGRYYGRGGFTYGSYYNKAPDSLSKHRAYPDTWKHSPAPLMDLLLLARSEKVTQFAIDVLLDEFKKEVRDLPLSQLIRLGQRPFGPIQEFIKKLIEENPSFQKAQFKELGLHELVVDFFLKSRSEDVRKYAIAYAQDYATDLPMETLLDLLELGYSDVNKFVEKQISKRDPREDLGLDGLQRLFLNSSSFELAKKLLKKGFRPSEIPREWFKALLFSDQWDVIEYSRTFLEKEYPKENIDVAWFQELLTDTRINEGYYGYRVRDYATSNMRKKAGKLDVDWIKEALLNSDLQWTIREWINDEKIKPKQLDVAWFKLLVDENAWNDSDWVASQKARETHWISDFSYPYSLSSFALDIFRAGTIFKPQELGLDWLLGQLQRSDETYRGFAAECLAKHFNPTDFANADDVAALPDEDGVGAQDAADNPFAGKSFLFTGKLRNLTRAAAQKKVEDIDGTISKSVTKKLDFLVVGDEGSPLFSEGKKGSKLTKAEAYQEEGLPIQIISETDWLRMLSEGNAAKADVDTRVVRLGFQQLHKLATDAEGHDAVRTFAIEYLQARHPLLGPHMSGEPLEGNQLIHREIYEAPAFIPLFEDERQDVQDLAIQIGKCELRRWQVPPTDIFAMCESPHRQVRKFAIDALVGMPDGKKDDKDSPFDFVIPPEELNADLVFALTENNRREVRQAGVALLMKYYDLLDGDQRILRLAESADRDVRAQAVKLLWLRYRRPSTAGEWTPKTDGRSPIQSGAKGTSLTSNHLLLDFVRTVLFGIPPGRLAKQPKNAAKPWSSSKAKRHMIDLLRDLALEDHNFYQAVRPIFAQFLASHHKTESLSSLVAITQLDDRWKEAA
jgi:hypothetical protein